MSLFVNYPSVDMLVPRAAKGSKRPLNQDSKHASARAPIVLLPEMCLVAPPGNRHEVKPAIALKLLRDIERSVVAWQTELRQVIGAIEALHVEGPMVNGWLASSNDMTLDGIGAAHRAQESCTETTLLRHGDTSTLMQYVEALEMETNDPLLEAMDGCSARAQYQLCWLDGEGIVCSQDCPPEQIAVVSTAIARYQKCKQLLAQQAALEARLQSVVDELTTVRNATQR